MSEQVSETSAAAPVANPDATAQADVAPPSTPAPAGLSILLEREAAVEAQRAELKAQEAEVSRWKEIASMPPAQKAQALGLTLQDLQKTMVESYDPNAEVTQKLSALEEKLLQQDQAREQAALEAARTAERNKIRTYIDGSKEFLITKAAGFHDTVADTIKMAAESGNTLSEEQAASKVEAGLVDLVAKAMAIPEIREKILGAQKTVPAAPSSTNTLTNKTASNSAAPRSQELLSEEEALERFAAMLA